MRWYSLIWLALVATVAAPISMAAADEPQLEVVEDANVDFGFAGTAEALPEHWLGVHCLPADETLKSHLGLKQGLVVHHVVPEGPAAKGGVKQHDVLLSIDGKDLLDAEQLTRLVGELKDKELSLELIRGGKKQSIKVTPAKRPEGDPRFTIAVPPLGAFNQKLEPEVRQFFQNFGVPGQEGVRMRILHPGMVTQKLGLEMPKDLTIQVSRTGNEPAKIVVKKGDKTWEVTEKELDKLPEELRPHVARFTHGGGDVIRWQGGGFGGLGGGGVIAVAPPIGVAAPQFQAVPVPAPAAGQRFEVRTFGGPAVQELEKKVKDLQDRVEAMEKLLKK